MDATAKHPILIVDDEPDILFSLRALLRRDFEVFTAESGARALEILAQRPIHLIMSDQRMPQMTGVELLCRARGECPQAIRMIFTGYADLKAVVDAVNRGEIYRYLTKPWDPDDLCAQLHQACEHYDALAERQRLLSDLRTQVAQGLELLKGPEAEAWTTAGKALLARLDRVLNRAPTAK
jgi:DNA-binding NtrC family response regulator